MLNVNESNNNLEILDFLYLAFMVVLLFNSVSILPKNINFSLFLYQAISFVIILYTFVKVKKLSIPKNIVLIYSMIFVQSIAVVLIGRAKFGIIGKECLQLAFLVIFAIALYNYLLKRKDNFIKFINIAVWFWILSALAILGSFFVFHTKFGIFLDSYFPFPRVTGLNVDPNVLGIYILTFLPLALYYNRDNDVAKIFLNVTSVFVVYLTYSRSNTVLAVAFIFIYFAFGLYTKRVSKKEVIGTVIILLIIAGIIMSIPTAKQATEVRTQQFVVENTVQSDSRFGLWIKGLKLVLTYPILGVGLDHSIFYIGKYIHNTFFELLISCGVLVGTGVSLFYFVNPFKHLMRARKSDLDFYMLFSYIGHIITVAFVSLINFEPTFILFALSAAILKNCNDGGSINFHREKKKTLY